MKINILRAVYTGASVVHKLNELINTSHHPEQEDIINYNHYCKDDINVLVYDYTPIARGNILIKFPNKNWEILKMNTRIFKDISKLVIKKTPHISNKSNWLSSIRRSSLNSVEI